MTSCLILLLFIASVIHFLVLYKALCIRSPLPLCVCSAAQRGLTGHGDSWAAPTELIWITPAFGARLRGASLSSYRLWHHSSPSSLPALCAPWSGGKCWLERQTGTERKKETGILPSELLHIYSVPVVTWLPWKCIWYTMYLRERTEKEKGRRSRGNTPLLCFGARRMERLCSLCVRLWVETKTGMSGEGKNKEGNSLNPHHYHHLLLGPTPRHTAWRLKARLMPIITLISPSKQPLWHVCLHQVLCSNWGSSHLKQFLDFPSRKPQPHVHTHADITHTHIHTQFEASSCWVRSCQVSSDKVTP